MFLRLIFISSDILWVLILWLYRIRWSICSATSTHVTVCVLPERASTTLRPLFCESLHSFPQALAVNDILNCHFWTKSNSFHTLWAQKSDRHFLLLLTEFCGWNSHVKLSWHYHYSQYSENYLDADLQSFVFFAPDRIFSLTTPPLRCIEPSFLYSHFLSLTFSGELCGIYLFSYCTCYW
jgi:hypothetical protein